ncbi:MAG: uncharacterized protein K0S32_3558 [Bacteroidetes bacterium]|jgi:hypothetical protein|nr:uncharacterized protein [Bacteroidota bacterium]
MGFFSKKKTEENLFKDYPAIGAVMASKLITEQKKKVCFLYREKPINEQDSGWRIFSGQETQEYTDDPKNTGIYNPTTIFKVDPSIADLLLNPVGSVFERQGENGDWYEVNDFEFPDDHVSTHQLTKEWTMDISNLFMRRIEEDGDLVYVMKGKTVRMIIWNSEGTKDELYKSHKERYADRDPGHEPILEKFELSDDKVARTGHMIEESDETKSYKVIYAFCFADNQTVQCALYFDDDKDKQWALDTWKSISLK